MRLVNGWPPSIPGNPVDLLRCCEEDWSRWVIDAWRVVVSRASVVDLLTFWVARVPNFPAVGLFYSAIWESRLVNGR
ncbi:hypothetical protein SLA2020_198270 [Shorea laevis]